MTPNIDRIAADGVRFTQAYANSAVCTSSATALMTGQYQYRLAIGLEQPLRSQSKRKIGLPPERHRTRSQSVACGSSRPSYLWASPHLSLPPVITPVVTGVCGNVGDWQPLTMSEIVSRYGNEGEYLRR